LEVLPANDYVRALADLAEFAVQRGY